MNESDFSLRDDYEVACQLDSMTETARAIGGCYGARMTGAGFGGCAISLVASNAVDAFSRSLLRGYRERTGIEGEIIVSSPGDGARRLA